MNNKKLKYILYLIVIVICCTIAIQVYWNYKNYQTNKQQLINDVQVSLDNAVDKYYENLALENTLSFDINKSVSGGVYDKKGSFEAIVNNLDIDKNGFTLLDSLDTKDIKGITIVRGKTSKKDCLTINSPRFNLNNSSGEIKWNKLKDSINGKPFELLTSKVVFSITNDSLKLTTVDSLLKLELNRKKLELYFGLSLKKNGKEEEFTNAFNNQESALSTTSKSTFLPLNSTLTVFFKNETKTILTRIISGILISALLVLAVIVCLFYLLKIITQQKQLAEIKNDLISNITHEFKTPIATIGVALESIKDFDVLKDEAKTKQYLNLSNTQLSKLNLMVEKLLETATLDSENLKLQKTPTNLTSLIDLLAEKHQMQYCNKVLKFYNTKDDIITNVDGFHFENAVNNIIDNALKYGGEQIDICLNKVGHKIEIKISDNGNNLDKSQISKIFEKFYRVPKGNTHDVKGFGIGLYYTKKIIEKHKGTVTIDLKKNTTFIITLADV